MKKFGLIGHPISHSLSPKLFKAAYDGKYEYDLIEGEFFEKSYQTFISDYEGINITAPFKEDAWKKADIRTNSCKKIGAANILHKKDGKIIAHNSDHSGIINSLKPYNLPAKTKALIVGCGGAGKAAVVAALDLGFEVSLYNRTQSRAQTWLKAAGITNEVKFINEVDFSSSFRDSELIIYTLPGMCEGLQTALNEDFIKSQIIFEANYKNPVFSGEILERLKKNEGKYISGREWLLYQAVNAYEIFTSEEVNFAKMK